MATEAKIGAQENAYFNGAMRTITTESSVLVSNSPYLNDAQLRDMIAQEMLRRNGPDLPTTAFIPQVAEMLFRHEDMANIIRLFEEEKARLPEFKRWLDDRHLADYRLDEVKDCAPDTLGAALHDFMVNSGYQLDIFYQEVQVVNDFTYYLRQTALTHDIEHIVTGFGPNHGGEVALLGANIYAKARYFRPELAAFFNRIQSYLRAKTIMKDMLYYPDAHVLAIEAEFIGMSQAQNWKYPIMLIDWRKYTDTPIDDIRAEFGITPITPHAVWADSNRTSQDPRYEEMAVAAE